MNKKLIIILCTIGTLLFIGLVAFAISKGDNTKKEGFIIHYYVGNSEYDIKPSGKYLAIDENEVIYCIKAPCDPIHKTSFKVMYKEEYYLLIQELLRNKDSNDITIYTSDLDDNKVSKMNDMVKYKAPKTTSAVTKVDYYDNDHRNRGYYIEEIDGKYVVTIAMGERHTGGYNISIINVETKDNTMTIYCEEKSPKPSDTVTQAFTYPTTSITLEKMPKEIIVINANNGTNYKLLKGLDK